VTRRLGRGRTRSPADRRRWVISATTRTATLADGTKYTRHDTLEEQLFDLVADPDEVAPLVADGRRRAVAVEALGDPLLDAADVAVGQAVTAPT
jgi:hypothetical protein